MATFTLVSLEKNYYLVCISKKIQIIVRKSDGFVNIAKFVASYSTTNWTSWYRYNKQFVKKVSAQINCDALDRSLACVKGNRTNIRGVYAHRVIFTAICCWMNVDFLLTACFWVEQWMTLESSNSKIYLSAVKNLVNSRGSPDMIGFVYFIHEKNDLKYFKIGCAFDVESRLKQLQTSNRRQLIVYKKIPSISQYWLENRFHEFFKEKRESIGEWFCITPREINKAIKTLNVIPDNYSVQIE